jgi:hypothetical protein
MEPMESENMYTTFAGDRLVVSGPLRTMLVETKKHIDAEGPDKVLIFEDQTGRQVDFDFRGALEEVLARAEPEKKAGPGRPKLGVVSREISLLPRHWQWLEAQPEGASAALRRLVEEARKREPGKQKARALRDAASKFMWTMAGNLPGFEEASRALFANDHAQFEARIRDFPNDVRAHLERLVAECARLEREG